MDFCSFGYVCVDNVCTQPRCGGFANQPCPSGYDCRYDGSSSLGTCYPYTCGGFAPQPCPGDLYCKYLPGADYGYCYPPLPPTPTGESCGGFRLQPQGCPDWQVCVDVVDPGFIADMPGVCVTRVDCGPNFGNTCPKNWECTVDSGDAVGYCVYDFSTPSPTPSPQFTPTPTPTPTPRPTPTPPSTPKPPVPTGRRCHLNRPLGQLLACPLGQVCVNAQPLSLEADGPGICVKQISCAKGLPFRCPAGWKCSRTVGLGYCEYDFGN